MKIEIGGGTKKRAGYHNFDPMESGEWGGRLGYDRIPVDDGVATDVYASHVMEHITKNDNHFIDAMNEVWRVLRPGGNFEIIAPCVGYTDHPDIVHVPPRNSGTGNPVYAGWQAFSDPTHTNLLWFPESFWYFSNPAFQANADYGKEMWEPGDMWIADGWEAHVTLIKPKGTR